MEREIVVGLAKSLQFSYSKAKQGEPTKWRDVAAEDRVIWERLARMAIRRITASSVEEASSS